MATREELMAALQAAHADGNEPAAIAIAQRIQSLQSTPQATPGAAPVQQATPAPSESFQRAGGHGPVAAGVAQSVIKAGMGVKQFFGGLSDDDKRVLEQIDLEDKADPNGFKRGAGSVLGSATMLLAPGIGTGAGAVLPRLAKAIAARSGPVAGGLGAAAATSGLSTAVIEPGKGDTYGEQMADKAKQGVEGAAIGMGLVGAGKLLKKAITRPFAPTPEAQQLFNQGVNPTLQQGADSAIGRGIGGLASGASKVKQRQDREVLDSYVKQYIDPRLDTTEMPLSTVVGLLDNVLSADRAGLLDGKTFRLTPAARSSILAAIRGPQGTDPMVAEKALAKLPMAGAAMQSTNNVPMKAHRLEKYRARFQDIIDSLPGDTDITGDAKKAWIIAKQRFDRLVLDPALTPEERVAMQDVNERFKYFSRLNDAAKNPSAHKTLRVEDLMSAFAKQDKKLTGGNAFARAEDPAVRYLLEPAMRVIGESPNQDQIRTLLSAAKRAAMPAAAAAGVVAGGPAMALAPLYGVSLAGQTAKGARILMGQTDAQKQMAEYLRQLAPYMSSSGAVIQEQRQ